MNATTPIVRGCHALHIFHKRTWGFTHEKLSFRKRERGRHDATRKGAIEREADVDRIYRGSIERDAAETSSASLITVWLIRAQGQSERELHVV